MPTANEATDQGIAALCEAGRHDLATARVLEVYAGEVMRFLVSRAGDAQLASEAFSAFSEDLCRGLPDFGFRSSVRTWVYALAHHALSRTRRSLARDWSRRVSLSDASRPALDAPERTGTPAYLRTEVKQRVRELRARLPEDDQLLLDLRTTRRFSWKDIARIRLGANKDATAAEIEKEAARLRKRFQLVAERLQDMAEAEGILPKRSREK